MELKRYFFIWLISVLVLLGLFICLGPSGKKIDFSEIDNTTTQSSYLFFKNLRSYYYDKIADENAGIDYYRLASRIKNKEDSLQVLIMNNWRTNTAILLFEKSDSLVWDKNLFVKWQKEDDRGELHLLSSNADDQYSFAAQLYYEIDRGSSIYIKNKQINDSSLKSLKTSLKDYFKLVGKIH